jgi:tetratricopeptide (TPR) repeat protein
MEANIAVVRLRSLVALTAGVQSLQLGTQLVSQLDVLIMQLADCGEPWATQLVEILANHPRQSPAMASVQVRALFAAGRFEQALATARQSLTVENAGGIDPKIRAELRWGAAAAAWNLNDWPLACAEARVFVEEYSEDRRARDMAVRALQAGLLAASASSAWEQLHLDALVDYLRKTYPDLPELADLPWQRGMLFIQHGQYAQAQAVLREVEPSSPLYGRSRYGFALALYKQVESGPRPARADEAVLRQAAEAMGQFFGSAQEMRPDDELAQPAVRLGLALAQRLLGLDQPAQEPAAALLTQLEAWPASGQHARHSRLAVALELACVQGDPIAISEQVQQGVRLVDPDVHLVRALTLGIASLERQRQEALETSDHTRAKVHGQMLRAVYQLVLTRPEIYEEAQRPDQLQAIHVRLGHLLRDMGEPQLAMSSYERVLAQIPAKKAGDVLRGVALCHEDLGQWDKAMEVWARLSAGLARATPDWYEARYHQILTCHRSGQSAKARQLLAYLRLQYPTINQEPWQQSFDKLHTTLNPASTPAELGPAPGGG